MGHTLDNRLVGVGPGEDSPVEGDLVEDGLEGGSLVAETEWDNEVSQWEELDVAAVGPGLKPVEGVAGVLGVCAHLSALKNTRHNMNWLSGGH